MSKYKIILDLPDDSTRCYKCLFPSVMGGCRLQPNLSPTMTPAWVVVKTCPLERVEEETNG